MASFFYALGWGITICGVGFAFYVASMRIGTDEYVAAAKLIAMGPGLALAGSGLLFVAVGAILSRLDRLIVRP